MIPAHRFSYQIHKGAIPHRYDVHHKCELPCCVNPDHLEAVTRKRHTTELTPGNAVYENARKTHCVNGHEFTPENTRLAGDRKGRRCITCHREEADRQHKSQPFYGKKKGPATGSRWKKKQRRTHCKTGHALEGDNVRISIDKEGREHQVCRTCHREKARKS